MMSASPNVSRSSSVPPIRVQRQTRNWPLLADRCNGGCGAQQCPSIRIKYNTRVTNVCLFTCAKISHSFSYFCRNTN